MISGKANPRRTLRPCVVFLALAWGISGAFAQQGTDLSETSLEQLGEVKVYSASKHLQTVREAPSSVTIISAYQIQQHGYRTLADILNTVRGFYGAYNRNYSTMGVRAFARPGDYNTRVLLLIDGHRLNDNIYDQPMLGTEFPIDIDLIERIEIIRGPVSALYGSNALFAVINVITKKGPDVHGVEFSSSVASFNTAQGRITYGQQLGKVQLLLSGSFYGSRGQKSLFFPEFNTPENNNGIARYADDDQVGSAFSTVQYRDFTLQAVYGTREKGIPTAPYSTTFNDARTRTTDSHTYIDLRYEHDFGSSSSLVARGFYDRYSYQGTYVYANTDPPFDAILNQDYADGKWAGGELQYSRTIFDRNRVTVGTEFRDNFRQYQGNFTESPFAAYLNDLRKSWVAAAYFQNELAICKSLSVNAGFRYDHYSNLTSSLPPRASLIYRPFQKTAIKAIYGEAFRVPNVYEMYYQIPPSLPNPSLQPETIRSTELTLEQGIGKQLWVSLSAFHNSIHRLITEVQRDDGQLIYQNIEEATSNGIEGEIRGQLNFGLEGGASYSFQRATDNDTNKRLDDSPQHLVKLDLTQAFFRRRLLAAFDAHYTSSIRGTYSNRISPYGVVNFTILGRKIARHADLSASIYNLLDKTYFDPPSSENLQQAIQQDGRSFRIKLTWHFGER